MKIPLSRPKSLLPIPIPYLIDLPIILGFENKNKKELSNPYVTFINSSVVGFQCS
jgi:hypothetical protein